MCVGASKPRTPAVDPAVEAQQEQQRAEQTAVAKGRKQEALEKTLTRRRGGVGRRSLIRGSRGGMGFYNEYLD